MVELSRAPEAEAPPAHARIESVRIRGFRSLRDVELSDLPRAAVLIGANGSGKSNVIRFFEMLSWMLRSRRLGEFVGMHGGADDQLFRGHRVTPRLEAEISIRTDAGRNDYGFTLAYAEPDRFLFTDERFRFSRDEYGGEAEWQSLESGHREAMILDAAQSAAPAVDPATPRAIVKVLRDCVGYQFHDTSKGSRFKQRWDVEDNARLRPDGGNLAAVLYRLEHEDFRRYDLICRHIARVLPNFDRFDIEESYGKVLLRWKAAGSDKTVGAHLTSDGSLRFFALVTLLNLPPELLPDVILLDEPELGIHPSAVSLIGGMIQSLAVERQIIVATQSPLLVDSFSLDEIMVLELEDGATVVRTFEVDDYRRWLEDRSTGQLWQKNLLGGRP